MRDRKGQSLVESALVVPMLLLLVFGIAELGWAWMTKNILTGAAREAVRLAAVPLPYGGDINAKNRADTILDSTKIPAVGRNVTVIGQSVGAYQNVSATVTYEFPVVLVGFIPGPDCTTIQLSSTTTMRREY